MDLKKAILGSNMESNVRNITLAKSTTSDEMLDAHSYKFKFWADILRKAEEEGASDVHLENVPNGIIIRFRVLGKMIQVYDSREENIVDFDRNFYIIPLKNIIGFSLDVNNKSDSKAFNWDKLKTRYRGEILPTVEGENIVLRRIAGKIPDFNSIEMEEETRAKLESSFKRKQGFIAITGPTGSGKSTTLQSILMKLDRKELKVISIEDPVERKIPYVNQIEISEYISWSDAIKSVMRFDPDVVLIGEIRDKESASLALEMAQTGHLVLSTLHTNDSAGVIDRLIGLGVDKQLIADNLLFVSAQRLAERLCDNCKVKDEKMGYLRGEGCEKCSSLNKGIKGRLPLIEFSYEPSRDSILNFSYNDFYENEVDTNLKDEIKKAVKNGKICKTELEKWGIEEEG